MDQAQRIAHGLAVAAAQGFQELRAPGYQTSWFVRRDGEVVFCIDRLDGDGEPSAFVEDWQQHATWSACRAAWDELMSARSVLARPA